MNNRLSKEFYMRSAVEVAPLLIGKMLCRQGENGVFKRMITETECYFGSEDSACHAKNGVTPRNRIIFEEGGAAYVYFCYGLHYLFNIVTGEKGHGEGVLIRGVEGAKGPGLVSRLFGIDKAFYGHDLCASNILWLEDEGKNPAYIALPRVGISYAEKKDREILWRYLVK